MLGSPSNVEKVTNTIVATTRVPAKAVGVDMHRLMLEEALADNTSCTVLLVLSSDTRVATLDELLSHSMRLRVDVRWDNCKGLTTDDGDATSTTGDVADNAAWFSAISCNKAIERFSTAFPYMHKVREVMSLGTGDSDVAVTIKGTRVFVALLTANDATLSPAAQVDSVDGTA